MAGIKWVSKYCSNVKFVLKVDDDVIVNSHVLLEYLNSLKLNSSDNLLCWKYENAPINRNPKNKFYISYNELAQSHYEPYCDGPAYMFQGKYLLMSS